MNKKKILHYATFLFILYLSTLSLSSKKALAAELIDKSDTMTRVQNSSADWVFSNHTILFTTPTGVASTEDIVITLPSDFNGTTDPDGNLDYTDVDLLIEDVPDGLCNGTAATLVDSGPGASEWSAVFSGTENRVLTITSGGASAVVASDYEVCIKIGENAVGGSSNSQYANPTSSGSEIIDVSAGSEDSGSIVVRIIDNDRVFITADITETISFSISDYTVGFGDLSMITARFATGDLNGTDGPPAVAAHTMSAATNGSSGYDITYNGATLEYGSDDVDPATIVGDADGEPGTEQFAIGFSISDDATVVSGYSQAANNYSFVENTETQFVYESGPSSLETISAYYLANISEVSAAGAYSTSLTYVATANF